MELEIGADHLGLAQELGEREHEVGGGDAGLRLARELDGDDIDALVQVGTNLAMARLAAQAEVWFAKPVIAINTAIYWHALRDSGITDKVAGFGSLLETY